MVCHPLGLVRPACPCRASTLALAYSGVYVSDLLLCLWRPVLLSPRWLAPLVGVRLRDSCYRCGRRDTMSSIVLSAIVIPL